MARYRTEMDLPAPIDWTTGGIGPGPDIPPERRVTRDNWRLWPYLRWAFQHTRELVPSREIRRSATPLILPRRPADLSTLRFDDGTGRTIGWDDFVAASYTDALLVWHRGAIITEHYLNGMTPLTPHHCFSVTKSFVGLLAEILIADGTIDPARPVTAYVPELAQSGFAGSSVRHLLDMTDGVAFDENYADPDADVHRYSASYWSPARAKGGARATLARLDRRDAPPGTQFAYRTPVADAVAWVLTRASNRRLADLFAERLWQPAGCAESGHLLVDTDGDEIAASGLNATAEDLLRLSLLMLPSHPSIPASARASIIGGGDRDLFAAARGPDMPVGSYRSQWWVAHNAHDAMSAIGVYGQRVFIEPGSDLVVVRLASYPTPSNATTEPMTHNAIATLRTALA